MQALERKIAWALEAGSYCKIFGVGVLFLSGLAWLMPHKERLKAMGVNLNTLNDKSLPNKY